MRIQMLMINYTCLGPYKVIYRSGTDRHSKHCSRNLPQPAGVVCWPNKPLGPDCKVHASRAHACGDDAGGGTCKPRTRPH